MHRHQSVISSPNDPQRYHYLVLKNKLRVLLVQNLKAEQSAASIAINVGHFDDPSHRQGMAHFLEHMLFLGTEKYSNPNDFQVYINDHGGSNNAWTGTEHTNFFFKIDSHYYEQALLRFSQFFISPLFCESFVNKERNAIESEFSLKINDDLRRIYQVHKETVSQAHPFSKFSVGNNETLAGSATDLRSELLSFYQNHYSANLMTLCLAGPHSLEFLEQLAYQHFESIENKKYTKHYPKVALYEPQNIGVQINITPLKNQNKLIICFPLPSQKKQYQYKSLTFISSLLENETQGSILSLLRKCELATELYAGGGISGYNFKDYTVSILLTDKGVESVNQVITICFEYIELIKKQGLTLWRYKERSDLLKLAFRYQPQTDVLNLVSYLSINMHHYSVEDIIYGDYRAEELNPKECLALLELMTPQNLRIQLISPQAKTNTVAKWYQTPYQVNPIDKNQITIWQKNQNNDFLKLPKPNRFIPIYPDVSHASEISNEAIGSGNVIETEFNITPQILSEGSGYKFWYLQETEFLVPKGHIFLSMDSSSASSNARQAALTRLYVEMLLDYLAEFTYQAEVAGLSYSIYPHQAGISLHLSGFTQNQEKLLYLIIEKARERNFTQSRFDMIKAQLIRRWINSNQAKPISQLFSNLAVTLQKSSFSNNEMAQAIKDATLEDLFQHVNEFYQKNHLEALIYGDWNTEKAEALSQTLIGIFSLVSYPDKELLRELIDISHRGTLVREFNIDHPDSAIIVYYQSNSVNAENNADFCLLNHIMSSAFFYELRTQQQLGYMVGTGYLPFHQHAGIIFYIQSPTTAHKQLLKAIDEFISNFHDTITQMSNTAWDDTKKGLIQQITKKDDNMKARSQRLWASIGNKDYQFNQKIKIAKRIKLLTQEELINFVIKNITTKNADRLILVSDGKNHQRIKTDTNLITNLDKFKQQAKKFILFLKI